MAAPLVTLSTSDLPGVIREALRAALAEEGYVLALPTELRVDCPSCSAVRPVPSLRHANLDIALEVLPRHVARTLYAQRIENRAPCGPDLLCIEGREPGEILHEAQCPSSASANVPGPIVRATTGTIATAAVAGGCVLPDCPGHGDLGHGDSK